MTAVKWLAILVVWVAVFASVPFDAHAQQSPNTVKADALKAEADGLMGNIRYDEALAKYAEAYKLSANAALLYNQGRALESLGRYPEALEMMKAFDAKASPELHARVPNFAKLVTDIQNRTTLLTIKVVQPGATIKLGSTVLGVSPLATKRVNAEKRAKVEVTLDGHDVEVQETELPGGGEKALSFDLLSKDKTGILVIDSPVKGATVSIDGMTSRQVPTEVKLPAGKHTVELKATGYRDNTVDVVVGVGERKIVTIEPGEPPVYEKWWFWTIWGGALAAGGASAGIYAALTEGEADSGTIPPGQVKITGERGAYGAPASFMRGGVRTGDRELGRPPFVIGPIPVLTVHF